MKKYALLKDDTVVQIKDLTDEEIFNLTYEYSLIIDVSEYVVIPRVGWLLEANRLVPSSTTGLTPEQMYQDYVSRARVFGRGLGDQLIDRLGARNLILGKTESQISATVQALAPISMLLQTGALVTSKTLITQIKPAYPEYQDIFDYAINQINSLLGI